MTFRIGVKLPHTGAVDPASVARRAVELERAGFDSLWVSDHVVLPVHMDSPYPFAADGVATWPSDTPYLEALVVLAAAAAVTERVELGTAVLIAPQRNPVLLAKQVATIDTLSGGRLRLGVGAGWLRAEFDALAADYGSRGQALEEWITVLRACWTGRPAAIDGKHYQLPADVLMLPPPISQPVPVLVGGHTPAALRRAGQLGDGWLGQQAVPELSIADLERDIAVVRANAEKVGRDPALLRFVLRLVESSQRHDEVASALPELSAAGIGEIIIDVHPDKGDPAAAHAILRDAVHLLDGGA